MLLTHSSSQASQMYVYTGLKIPSIYLRIKSQKKETSLFVLGGRHNQPKPRSIACIKHSVFERFYPDQPADHHQLYMSLTLSKTTYALPRWYKSTYIYFRTWERPVIQKPIEWSSDITESLLRPNWNLEDETMKIKLKQLIINAAATAAVPI